MWMRCLSSGPRKMVLNRTHLPDTSRDPVRLTSTRRIRLNQRRLIHLLCKEKKGWGRNQRRGTAILTSSERMSLNQRWPIHLLQLNPRLVSALEDCKCLQRTSTERVKYCTTFYKRHFKELLTTLTIKLILFFNFKFMYFFKGKYFERRTHCAEKDLRQAVACKNRTRNT